MKSTIILFIAGFLLFLSACGTKGDETNIIFIPREGNSVDLLVSDDAAVTVVRTKGGGEALQFTCGGKNKAPYVIIHDRSGAWKFSGHNYLVADVTNLGDSEVLAEIRLNANGWGAQGSAVAPGETRTLKIVIPQNEIPDYYRKKIIGLYNLPDAIITSDQPADSIHKISFLLTCPPKNTKLLISNLRLEGTVRFPTEEQINEDFFPLLDEFGQYRHTDWPVKTHSLEELRNSAVTELSDLENNPEPADRNKYGGWMKGPQLNATGHFRTEKIDGKWWLVDPEGRLFWSHGMGSVTVGGGSGVITDREFYYSGLPDSVQYREFYSTSRWAPFGYYKGRTLRSFDIIAWNMMRKYGENWKEHGIKLAEKRIKSWGQNTFGAWTTADVFLEGKIPYSPIIMIGSKRLEGSIGHWYKFIDPFDTSMVGNLTRKIKAIGKSTSDPYCIGYFVDNEFTWGGPTSMAEWTIASPPDQAAKNVMLVFLKKRYPRISDLNKSWKTSFTSWDAFMQNTDLLDIKNDDTREFTMVFIEQYFQNVLSTIRKLAPGKLYLGPRLDFHFYPSESDLNPWDSRNNWLVNIAARYCDVVSFNRYRSSAEDLRPGDLDKAVIIGEWHHTPLEQSAFYMGPGHFRESLKMRAEKYEYFINSCLRNPFIVGAHYFQYLDQPTAGRGDGENFSCGFLTICDRPYTEMVDVSRKTGRSMYEKRYSGK